MPYTGPERRRSPNRFVVISLVVACVYMTGVFVLSEIRNRDFQGARSRSAESLTYTTALDSCDRGLGIRHEMNARIKKHEADAANLAKLASTLAHTRSLEAGAFVELGRKFKIADAVQPLVVALRNAEGEDRKIAAIQSRVAFARLAEVPCNIAVEKP